MTGLVCIFGGTFDPVHYGHLKPLAELQQQLAVETIHIVPASIPPHRPQPQANTAQRVKMLELALADYPGFRLDTRELERSGPSWMVDTLKSFRKQYPDSSLCLIVGSDAFNGLRSWYHWQEIPDLANIIVVERAGQQHAFPQWAQDYLVDNADLLRARKSSCVMPVTTTGYNISATDIRRRMHQGDNVDGMMPGKVLRYIREQGLYQDG